MIAAIRDFPNWSKKFVKMGAPKPRPTGGPATMKQRSASLTVKRTLEVVRHILHLAARKWRTKLNQPWLLIAPPLLEMPKNPHARAPYCDPQ